MTTTREEVTEAGAVEDTRSTAPALVEHRPPASAEADHMNLLWKLARMTTNTEMIPKALRGRPDAALAVMVYGHELGLRPMTSLREVYIVDGSPSCSAKLMRSLILRAGHSLVFREVSSERCVVHGTRSDGRAEAVVTWTMDDARTAGVAAKDVWKKYPRAMLAARATSELARLVFPDVTIGYTPEELQRVDLSGEYDYLDVEDVPGVDEEERRSEVPASVEDALLEDAELVEDEDVEVVGQEES
jgi:hypothetical protein